VAPGGGTEAGRRWRRELAWALGTSGARERSGAGSTHEPASRGQHWSAVRAGQGRSADDGVSGTRDQAMACTRRSAGDGVSGTRAVRAGAVRQEG
jgi:hypothetical protein